MEYGLIGAKLGHSYSKIIHEAVCGYSYELHPLPTEEEAHAFMQAKAFKAINVTIPYKKLVIPYCDGTTCGGHRRSEHRGQPGWQAVWL